jgi:hypothetical protein
MAEPATIMQAFGMGRPRIPKLATNRGVEGLVWTDGVADRGSNPDDIVRSEVGGVVVDHVVVRFGADEDVAPDVVTDAAADIDQEMVGTDVVGAAYKVAPVGTTVEASALPTDSSHQVKTCLLAEPGLVHAVEVKQDRAEGYTTWPAVGCLPSSPRGVKAQTDTFVEDYVETNIGIQPPLFGATGVEVTRRSSGRHQRTETEHGIGLLG